MTRGFDINNPTDPSEGTASVTFSTDMGNGTSPADVEPLPADPAQYPWPRQAEPRVANGQLVVNPRDQLVTIIAMTQGEEAFVDANHNGVLDIGETFIDQGDPFIDANDNGVYDQLYTGGPWELRFCGQGNTNCAAYQGPNGKWDSLTTIWVPTWVVFTGVTSAHIAAAGQPAPAADYSPACIPHNVSAFAEIYIYDTFLNTPASGTGYNDPRVEQGNVGTRRHGFGPELDGWGAMGNLGVSFDYRIVSPAGGLCQSPAAPTAPTPCVQRLLFRNFDLGWRGTIETFNGGGTTTCPSTTVFKTSLQTNCAHGSYDIGYQSGTYAP
jgi:hypothetical protein